MRTPGSWPAGVTQTLPLVVPTFAVGGVFGLLAEPVMGAVAPIVMSCIVFAGGSQFAALSVLSAGGGAATAVLAGACVNLRFLPTGFAIAPALKGGRLRRAAEGQTVVDASFVIAARGDGTFDRATLLWSTAVQAVCWISGTVIGVVAADAIPDPERYGLDVLLPVFFLTLLASELRQQGHRAAVVAGLAALLTAGLTLVLPAGLPVVAAAAAALLGLWWPLRQESS
jgi:predicted branched-subunit amino acid permease